jgi:amino acid transporter
LHEQHDQQLQVPILLFSLSSLSIYIIVTKYILICFLKSENLNKLTCVYVDRMVYAFSRDGAVPLSKFWHRVDQHDVPRNAVWLSAFVAFAMTLPVSFSSLHHKIAFIFVNFS